MAYNHNLKAFKLFRLRAQVEDEHNFEFGSRWLATFGLKSPTSLEAQEALQALCQQYSLLGSKASAQKIEASLIVL